MSFVGFDETVGIYGEHGNRVFDNARVVVGNNGLYVAPYDKVYSRDEISSVEHNDSEGQVLVKTSSGTLDLRSYYHQRLHDALSTLLLMG